MYWLPSRSLQYVSMGLRKPVNLKFSVASGNTVIIPRRTSSFILHRPDIVSDTMVWRELRQPPRTGIVTLVANQCISRRCVKVNQDIFTLDTCLRHAFSNGRKVSAKILIITPCSPLNPSLSIVFSVIISFAAVSSFSHNQLEWLCDPGCCSSVGRNDASPCKQIIISF